MRTLLIGVFGCLLVIVGSIAGVGGLGGLITDPCTQTYRLSVQPVDSVSDPPDQTVSYGELTEVQQVAVDAALENRSRLSFRDREPLDELADTVIEKDGGRYVTHVIANECRTLYDNLAIAGFTSAIGGLLLVGAVLIIHRHS